MRADVSFVVSYSVLVCGSTMKLFLVFVLLPAVALSAPLFGILDEITGAGANLASGVHEIVHDLGNHNSFLHHSVGAVGVAAGSVPSPTVHQQTNVKSVDIPSTPNVEDDYYLKIGCKQVGVVNTDYATTVKQWECPHKV